MKLPEITLVGTVKRVSLASLVLACNVIAHGEPDKVSRYALDPDPEIAAMAFARTLRSDHAYTLSELIDLAHTSSPLALDADLATRQAALGMDVVRSTTLPHVAATLLGARLQSQGETRAAGLGVDGNGSVSASVAALAVQWLLFDFGQRDANAEAAQHEARAAQAAQSGTHQAIIESVCRTYYAWAAAQARVDAAQRSLANADLVQTAAQERLAQGIGTVLEVAQAQQARAQARLAQVQAEGAAQDSYLAVLGAVGLSPLSQLQLAPLPKRLPPKDLHILSEPLLQRAVAQRADVASARAMQRSAQARVRAAQAEFLPKVFLSATGNYNSQALSNVWVPPIGPQSPTFHVAGDHWGSTVMVGVTMPIFDAGLRATTLAQARTASERSDAQFEKVRNDAARQILIARNALQTSLASYEAAQALTQAATTGFDAALAAYHQGVGTLTDATLAETQLLAARNAQNDAYSAALTAALTLVFANGAPDDTRAVP